MALNGSLKKVTSILSLDNLFGNKKNNENEGDISLRDKLKKAGKVALNFIIAAGATIGAVSSLASISAATGPLAIAALAVSAVASVADAGEALSVVHETTMGTEA